MVELRGLPILRLPLPLPLPLPLVLVGSTGVALLGFGLTGLSGVEPQLARADGQVREQHQQQRNRRIVPDVPAVPPTAGARRLAGCPEAPAASAAGKV